MKNVTKLRMIRQIKGYKQEYVAERLGTSQTNYSNIESGKTEMKLDVLERFAKIHGIEPADILQFGEQYIFNNHNQQGGEASSVSTHHHYSDKIIKVYESQIKWLEKENEELKTELKSIKK
jgi:transcriptional regulator with XRE-family HTH domain